MLEQDQPHLATGAIAWAADLIGRGAHVPQPGELVGVADLRIEGTLDLLAVNERRSDLRDARREL